MAVETPLAQTPREVADVKDSTKLTTRSGRAPALGCGAEKMKTLLRTMSSHLHSVVGRRAARTGLAVLMLLVGTTILRPTLNPHEHAGWFMLFWFACAWITVLALLLAILDLLITRIEARDARKALRGFVSKPSDRE